MSKDDAGRTATNGELRECSTCPNWLACQQVGCCYRTRPEIPDDLRLTAFEWEGMYYAQCQATDEWRAKYEAESEKKADATLTKRVKELEQQLATVNGRLADAQNIVALAAQSETTSRTEIVEECAKVCEEMMPRPSSHTQLSLQRQTLENAARLIRALKNAAPQHGGGTAIMTDSKESPAHEHAAGAASALPTETVPGMVSVPASLAKWAASTLESYSEDNGSDLDGGYLFEVAKDSGVIVAHAVTEPCDRGSCACAETGEFPTECYRYAHNVRKALKEIEVLK